LITKWARELCLY